GRPAAWWTRSRSFPPYGAAPSEVKPRLGQQPEAPQQDGLLGVDAILRLVEHDRLRPLEHACAHLFAHMGRKAVKETRVRAGTGQQRLVDLERGHRGKRVVDMLLAHRHP